MKANEFITEGSSEYNILRQLAKAADDKSTAASDELNKFPKGEMGLTPDSVKQDPAWQKAKKEYDTAFAELRHYNGLINKNHKKEHKAARDAERAARYKVPESEALPSVKTPTPEQLAAKHGVPLIKINRQVAKGTVVELEHTTDRKKAREIALDHILELPDYYDRLHKMEKE